jgi:hypothetical protein
MKIFIFPIWNYVFVIHMSQQIVRNWDNWASVAELSLIWDLTPRRVRQIMSDYLERDMVQECSIVATDVFGKLYMFSMFKRCDRSD